LTTQQKIDLGLFIVVAIVGLVAFWKAGSYGSGLAQRVRFRAAGIVLGVSLLPIKAFLVDRFSTPVWALLLFVVTGAALFFFYWASRRD
jgi:hypothetical protein